MALTVPDNVIPHPDADAVREALTLLIQPGERFEIRGLPSGRSYVGTSIDAAAQHVRSCAADNGIYWSLNALRADLTRAASDRDVIGRRWFLVDIDPVRPSEDAPANEAERGQVAVVAGAIISHLSGLGWPDPIVVDSGNGIQLLYRVDLPATDLARQWIRAVLVRLSERFTGMGATVDTTVHNASRIARLPGTWNRKGEQSADRPYRMAEILSRPQSIETVSADLIQSYVGPIEPEPPRPQVEPQPITGGLTVPRVMPSGEDVAWYRRALENECAKVMLAPNGQRHTALKNASVTVAGYLHTGAFSRQEMIAALQTAGIRAGLPPKEVADLIVWGETTGTANPLPRAAKLDAPRAKKGKALPDEPDASAYEGKRLFVLASSIKPRKVEWLWPGRVPLGKMTTFAGMGGVGKTLCLCDIAARVSAGLEWPIANGECAERGKVLFISGEDDEDDTLVPRLMEAGADLSRIAFLSPEIAGDFHLAAIHLLREIIGQIQDVRLVVIDPPSSYLSGVDDHKNAEIRSILTPLKLWASEARAALIFNTHVNKAAANIEAAGRVMGSVAWVNAVRAAHMFVRDGEDKDKIIFAPIKINIARRPLALSYQVIEGEAGPKVEWLGEIDQTADEAMAGLKKKSRGVVAIEWLADRFREQRSWWSDDLKHAAKEAGISKNALWSPEVQALPIRKRRRTGADGDTSYEWVAEDGWPPIPGDESGKQAGNPGAAF